MSRAALLQLVSEQTLPNILPALALEPAEIVLLHTPRTRRHADQIRAALQKAGLPLHTRLIALSGAPDIRETGAAVKQTAAALPANLTPVVNFTGGTKLMSIGAFVAAYTAKIPSLYVDTANLAFTDGGTGDLPLALRDNHAALARAKSRLNLDIVAAAHGIQGISAGLDPAPLLPLALHLLRNPGEERTLNTALQKLPNANPRKPAEVAALLSSPLPQNLLSPTAAKLALDAGILDQISGKHHFARPASLEKLEKFLEDETAGAIGFAAWQTALAPLQTALNFFGGGWWELAVFDAAQRSGEFRDLRWSVTITVAGQTYEKDLIALHGLNLALFSCKRGASGRDRLVAALDELDANARQIGGTHARRYFCVAAAISKQQIAPLQERARQTGTQIIGPAQSLNPNSF